MCDSVPSTRYSSVCNVLRQRNIPLIPTYRVYRLYDMKLTVSMGTYNYAVLIFMGCFKMHVKITECNAANSQLLAI